MVETGVIEHSFRNHTFHFQTTHDAPALIQEIFSDNYHILQSNLEFSPGDIILDLGANEGMFSCMMAALFPQTRILSFEPVSRTFETLRKNTAPYSNIEIFNIGVGGPGHESATINISKECSGGSSSVCTFVPSDMIQETISLTSLDAIFMLHNIAHCRLLKIDVEGMEYEILYGTDVLSLVDYVVAEFHVNNRIQYMSYRPDALANWVGNQTKLLHVELCKMCE